MDKTNEKCIHDGHRKRLINTINKAGLDGLSDIQVVESLLFFVFPRGDVNPLAHRLLDRFGNFHTILDASVEDLMAVKGMGLTSAQKLHSLMGYYDYYLQEKLSTDGITTIGEFFDFLEVFTRHKNDEGLYIFGVNVMGKIMDSRCLATGSCNWVSIEMGDVALYVSTSKLPAVFLVHNHPQGFCHPSEQDTESFDRLRWLFKFSGCKLIDLIIVGKDGMYSMDKSACLRVFSQECLRELLQ